jgi:hypothetical protein
MLNLFDERWILIDDRMINENDVSQQLTLTQSPQVFRQDSKNNLSYLMLLRSSWNALRENKSLWQLNLKLYLLF